MFAKDIRNPTKYESGIQMGISKGPPSFAFLLLALLLLIALPRAAASTTDNLNGVAMLSSNSGWAVGNAGTIEHFDGSSWNLIPSGTSADLFGISFGPPSAPNSNAGFAVGGSGGSGVALFWSGFSWTPIMSGLSSPDAKQLRSVSSLSPDDAWAVDSITGTFWHWSGTAGLGGGWGEISTASAGLNSVFMTSSSDGWAVGAGGIIYHFAGGGWIPFSNVGTTLNSVFMVSQSEGWAVGDGGAIFHYSSGTWTGSISPAVTNQDLSSIFMVSETEGWVVGAGGTIVHYVNGGWSLFSNQFGVNQNLNSVSFSGGVGWAVGDLGTIVLLSGSTPQGVLSSSWESVYLSNSNDGWIVGCSTGGCGSGSGEPSIQHWNGNSFTRGNALGAATDLYSVFMSNPSEGWAVGGVGSVPGIFHYTGGAWTQTPSPPMNGIIRGVFDSGDVWAVGDHGVILHYSGSWGAVSSPTSNSLRSIFMTSPSDGWAVGDSGTLLRYQSGQWVNYPSSTSAQLNSVFFLNSNQGWAVGSGGTVLHFDGNFWSPVATGVSSNLNSIAQVNPQEAWAVGDSATILQWNGVSWYQVSPSPPLAGNPNLNSLFISTNGFGLIVGAPPGAGSQGTVVRFSALSPVPEFPWATVSLAVGLAVAIVVISFKRRKIE